MDCYDSAMCPGNCSECQYWLEINKLQSDTEYQSAMEELSSLMDKDPAVDTVDGDRFRELASLIEVYEKIHYPMMNDFRHVTSCSEDGKHE